MRGESTGILPTPMVGVLIALLPILLPGCEESPRAGDDRLPPVPEIDLATFEPSVSRQFDDALRRVGAEPPSSEANGELGMLLQAYSWLDKAETCYRRATILAPDDYRWWSCLARVQIKLGKATGATRSLTKAVEAKSDHLAGHILLGELALERREFESARRWFDTALEIAPGSPHGLTGLGQVSIQEGDTARAIDLFEQALTSAPRFGRAMYQLALAYRASGDLEKARLYFGRHAESNRESMPEDELTRHMDSLRVDADHVLRTANKLMRKEDYPEAIRKYRKVLDLTPHLPMAEYNIGLALQMMKKPHQAMQHYKNVLRQRPGFLDALNNLGTCHDESGNSEEALAYFKKAIAVERGYYQAHFNLGLTLARKGDTEGAMESFRTTLSIRPNHAEAHFHLGHLLNRAGKGDQSLRHFVKVLSIEPDDDRVHELLLNSIGRAGQKASAGARSGEAHRRLAEFLRKEGLFEAAIHSLRDSLRDFPSAWRNRIALAWMLATTSDESLRRPVEAVRLAESVCRTVGRRDPRALDTLAVAYAACGRFDDASRTASEALRLAEELSPDPGLAKMIRFRLEQYEARSAHHEK